MIQKRTSTSARLMPEEPREILTCAVIACLVAAFIFIFPRIVAAAMYALGVIG